MRKIWARLKIAFRRSAGFRALCKLKIALADKATTYLPLHRGVYC